MSYEQQQEPATPAVTTKTIASGTAFQASASNDSYVTVVVTTAGTAASIAIGPTGAAATVIVSAGPVAVGPISLRLPAGWFAKVTNGGSAVFSTTAFIQVV